jgi:hypothetical protein
MAQNFIIIINKIISSKPITLLTFFVISLPHNLKYNIKTSINGKSIIWNYLYSMVENF